MPFCKPSKIIVPEGRFRTVDIDHEEVKDIAESIEALGQLQPILITKGKELIDGLNRLKACELLKRDVWWEDEETGNLMLENPIMRRMAELHANIKRKDFTTQQRSLGINEVHKLMQELHGTPGAGGRGRQEGWTGADTAKKLGFKSPRTVYDAVLIADAIESKTVPGIEKAASTQEALKIVKDVIQREATEELTRRKSATTETEIGDPYEYFGKRLIVGSCTQLQQQPPNICTMFITDPPWKIDVDKKEQRNGSTAQKSLEEYDDSSDEILPLLETIIKEMARVGKQDCWVVMFCGAKHWNWLQEQFNKNGFQVYGKPLVWVRTQKDGSIFHGKSAVPSRWPASTTDFMLLARRGDITLAKMNEGDAFLHSPVSGQDKIHRAQKPLPLMEEIISRFYHPGTNPLLIDPFAGSGVTLIAARRVGIKNYFGYELSPGNREKAISYMVREYLEESKPATIISDLDLSDFE